MRKLSVVLALLALCTASTLTLHAENYAVRGTIQEFGNAIGTRPLAGATVKLSPGDRSAITDANGFYSIGSVPAGTYTLRVGAPGHHPIDTRITVSSDVTLNYVLQIDEVVRYDLRGVVTESGSFGTRPLKGAVVRAMPSGRTSTTDASGRYAFENLARGTYTLTATAKGHQTVSRSVPLGSDAEVGIDLPVTSTTTPPPANNGAVSGVILDGDGHAISGASIRLTPGNYTATTDSQGRFTLPSIRNGTYMLHLKAPGYHAMNRKVTIGSDRTITLTMNGGSRSDADNDHDDDDDGDGGHHVGRGKEHVEKDAMKGHGHGHGQGKSKGRKK